MPAVPIVAVLSEPTASVGASQPKAMAVTCQESAIASKRMATARPRPSPTRTADVSATPAATGHTRMARTCCWERIAERALRP